MMNPGPGQADLDLITAIAHRFCDLPGGGTRPAAWDDVLSIAVEAFQLGELKGLRVAAAKSGYLPLTQAMRRHLISLLRNDLQMRQAKEWKDFDYTLSEALLAESESVTIPGDPDNKP